MFLYFSISLFLFSQVFSYDESLQISLSTGIIEGKYHTSTYSPFGNQTARIFLGIPFAEPPINENRFRKPKKVKNWNGILETKEYGPACMSEAKKTYKTEKGGLISEDCLYLNVFTNDYCMKNKNCAVYVVIHGGGFKFESASAFDPNIIINNFVGQDRNIVVVTPNYRLGVFGMAHLNGNIGNSADHNVALYDVLETLKWVQKEIPKFGGSIDRVTLGGHSGGATLVSMLAMSPLSKGLIKQQVLMSGQFSTFSKLGNTKGTRAVAIRLGCLSENSSTNRLSTEVIEQTFECLRKINSQALFDAQLYVLTNTTYTFDQPYIDGTIIVDYPDIVLESDSLHKMNTMMGTLTAEFRETEYCQDENGNPLIDRLDNMCSHIGYQLAYSEPEQFRKMCIEEYKEKNRPQFLGEDIELYGSSIRYTLAFLSNQTNAFVYSYSYNKAGEAFQKYAPSESPSHSEDLIYVMGTHRGKMLPKDYVIEKIYSKMFADFVNFGDPSPSQQQKWKAFTAEKREYFNIDFDSNFQMPGSKDYYYEKAHQFWNVDVPSKLGPILHVERFSKSFDTTNIGLYSTAYHSHYIQHSTDPSKNLENLESQYYELSNYLKLLKFEYQLGQAEMSNDNSEILTRSQEIPEQEEISNGFPFDILLGIVVLIVAIIIFYAVISNWISKKKRHDYVEFE